MKKQLCEGYVQGAGARASAYRTPVLRPLHEVGGGVAWIAVEAQAGGADGVPDDQHDVAGARRRRRQAVRRAVFPDRLAAGRESRQDNQQAEEPRQGLPRLPRVPAARRDRGADRPPQPGGQKQRANAVQRASEAGPPRSPASRTATPPHAGVIGARAGPS